MRMYVGNLDFGTTDMDLLAAFTAYGDVVAAIVMRNGATGEARGFGYVEMEDHRQARRALSALDGSKLRGRTLIVNQEKQSPLAPALS